MTDKKEKLKLESALNQIYNNDNLYDGSVIDFTFYSVNYIYLNGIYLYPHSKVTITIDVDCMIININSTLIEVIYSDIDIFIINIKEDKDV